MMKTLQRLRTVIAGAILGVLLLAGAGTARADTPIQLYQSYAGNVNFVGTQRTMRTASNNSNACSTSSAGTLLYANLAGIPAAATVISAHLYWTGSGSTADYTVTFEGSSFSAPTARRYSTTSIGTAYFSGAVDVTAKVQAKRNGSYAFSGLTIDNTTACGTEGVVGGFALLVIFSEPAQTYRVLNLYEGFQYIRTFDGDNVSVTLNLSNFQIPSPLGSATGRIGHITWEGDPTLSGSGEELRFNGTQLVDAANPTGNQFNSYSSINGDANSYGIDFDAYTLSSPVIQAGQTSAITLYKSGQDLVLLSAEIVGMPNVPVSDLSLTLVRSGTVSPGQTITYTYSPRNLGPSDEPGPSTVTITLATGLTFQAAVGSGWTCPVSGQTITCSRSAPMVSGAAAIPIVVTATINVGASSPLVTTAVIDGANFDNVAANNSVSDSMSLLSDLSAAMSLSNASLVLGVTNSYIASVTNIGPATEAGPVSLSVLLDSELSYISYGGAGWSCTPNAQQINCSHGGALAAGEATPALNINFVPGVVAASVTSSASADGAGIDQDSANDSVSLTSTMTLPTYVFTDSECVNNRAFNNANQTCKIIGWGNQAAGASKTFWITALAANGRPTNVASVNMYFALSCHNPSTHATTQATVTRGATVRTLPTCTANGAAPAATGTTGWSTAYSVAFSNTPSDGPFTFVYDDVGRIEFYMKELNQSRTSSGQFVSTPSSILLAATGNPYAPPVGLTGGANSLAYVKAGANFTLTTTALTSTGAAAKNFGREVTPETIAITLATTFEDPVLAFARPALTGTLGAFSGGVASGSFSWSEVGVIDMTAALSDNDYIGSGAVTPSTITVGRFVPSHYTTVVSGGLACSWSTASCAAPATQHYALQPITTTVTAHNAAGAVTTNYRGMYARAATLTAVTAKGAAAAPAPAGTLGSNTIAAAAFNQGVALVAPTFALPAPYTSTSTGGWSNPLTVFIRAATTADSVTSLRTVAADSVEGGTWVVNGRTFIEHAYGSEKLKLRINLKAQYWTGTRWESSLLDSDSTSVYSMTFSECKSPTLSAIACPQKLSGPAGATLEGGQTTYQLKALGVPGRAELLMGGAAWLPSSKAQLRFGGVRHTPVIYLREVF